MALEYSFLSEIWQLKMDFYPKYGSLFEKVVTFEVNIKDICWINEL